MRFYILVAFLALIAGVFALGDRDTCMRADPDVLQAINNMCGWTWDLVVPSVKAWGGAYSNNKRVKVSIQGTCKPQQWVPMKYCLSQFIKTCAKGARAGTYGRGEMRFGNGGCQRFMITSNG